MKIIKVAGCINCPHGAKWEIDKPHYMCAEKTKVNENGPKPPDWCPLEDAMDFIKSVLTKA